VRPDGLTRPPNLLIAMSFRGEEIE